MEQIKAFKVYSNERRMERYLCIYIWKSLNGMVPSLGFKWNEVSNRSGQNLNLPSLINPTGSSKTLLDASLKSEGVKIYNSLPDKLKL